MRFTQEIKKKDAFMPVAILSAGISSRMKTHEPRSLLKIGDKPLIEHQCEIIKSIFYENEIILVIGYKSEKIIKKIGESKIRIIENQLFEETNSGESLRLAVMNNVHNRILLIHGDLYFNLETFKDLNYSKSFLLIDNNSQMSDREVGVVVDNNKVTNLSYGLKSKWCQIAYFQGQEYQILKQVLLKDRENVKKKVSFEIINEVIDKGGCFYHHEPKDMNITEIDCIRDINNDKFKNISC
jgi:choline kinase